MFKTTLNVRIDDLSYGVHLGYAQMVALLHQARVEFLSSLGLSEIDCFGYALMMTNIHVDYKSECFLGEKLNFEIKVNFVDRLRVCFDTIVSHEENRVAVHAKESMIFIDQNKKKPVRMPDRFKELIESHSKRL